MSKLKHIRVVILQPGGKPKVTMMENDLHAMQAIVGGYIDIVRGKFTINGAAVDMIINDEGLLQGLEPCFMAGGIRLVGPVIFAKPDNSTGEFVSFSESEAATLAMMIEAQNQVSHQCAACWVPKFFCHCNEEE